MEAAQHASSSTGRPPEKAHRSRGAILAAGILAILAGIVAIVVPVLASVATALLIGWVLVGMGGFILIDAFSRHGLARIAFRVLLAIATFIAGLYLVFAPLEGTYSLTVILVIWFVATGLTQTMIGIAEWKMPGAGLMILERARLVRPGRLDRQRAPGGRRVGYRPAGGDPADLLRDERARNVGSHSGAQAPRQRPRPERSRAFGRPHPSGVGASATGVVHAPWAGPEAKVRLVPLNQASNRGCWANTNGGAPMRGEGSVVFAAILLVIVGTLNILYGIGALDGANLFVDDTRYILSDLNTLGWVLLVLGVIQLIGGFSLAMGQGFGRVIGIIGGSLGAIGALLSIGGNNPWWSLGIFALCVIVVHGIVVFGKDEHAARVS